MKSINLNGQLLTFEQPKIMGIVNTTPDSFYDGGILQSVDDVLQQVHNMLSQGADMIDVGAYSSRPQSTNISIDEELQRIKLIAPALVKTFPQAHFCIDTFRSEVAHFALQNGFAMVNDISAGSLDVAMFQVVKEFKAAYVMMHMKGTPQTMQQHCSYEDMLKEMLFYFSEKIALARSYGLNDIVIDLGYGFAKSLEANFELLAKQTVFKTFDLPILSGISRKSFIYKTLNLTAQEALNGTSALHMIALQNGADILRVHDVREAVEVVKLYQKIKVYEA